ncbi:MAG: N-acetylmuramoyl-L-alanine amidase [Chloroflexi bacterium]|nr:N-acetylmuramoyl-L-alanine amidase [Chloroflexota bacterium]
MSELWFPGAERLPGPARKTSGTSWPKQGVVMHSAEGWWAGLRSVLFNVRRRADGSFPGSWHFSNLTDGSSGASLYQHYPIDMIVWHARHSNRRYVGVEHEGKVGQALTELQISNDVGLVRWLKEVCEWGDLSRARPEGNMVEHQEVGIEHGYATACPSRRIPWIKIMVRAEKEDDVELLKQLEKNANWGAVMRALDAKLSAGVKPTDAEIALGRWVLAEVEKAG